MVIEKFEGKVIFLDTAPLIYFIEGHSKYQPTLQQLFALNDSGNFKFLTSSITLLEVMVKPLKEEETKIVEKYKTILTNAKGMDIVEITIPIAMKAAELRAKYKIHTPDALQIATAIEHQADYFLTNDQRLKSVTEITIFTLSELE